MDEKAATEATTAREHILDRRTLVQGAAAVTLAAAGSAVLGGGIERAAAQEGDLTKSGIAKIALLWLNEEGLGFGPSPGDHIDAEVIVRLANSESTGYGFQLRAGKNALTHQAMYDLLRDAFLNGKSVEIEYLRVAGNNNHMAQTVLSWA